MAEDAQTNNTAEVAEQVIVEEVNEEEETKQESEDEDQAQAAAAQAAS